jgi:putative restriction endonuclease
LAPLRKEAILDRILAAIRAAGWNVVFLRSNHPYDLTIFKDDQSFRVRLYVWNVTHGGGPVRAATEYRIQITGVDIPLIAPIGFQTLLFGWYDDLGVIAAFDPERHRTPSTASPSIQISIGTLNAAAQNGLEVQERGNQEIALAFRPELLITYIENQAALHAFAGDRGDIDLLVQAGAGREPPQEAMRNVPPERKRVIRMVVSRRREADFRDRVLAAYGHACAVCHLQLDLVEAAHIIPVAAPRGSDETSNGLALCPSHHEAYDDSIVGVLEDYRIVVNKAVVDSLRKAGRGGEEERFRRDLQRRIIVPAVERDRPQPEYLRRGLQIRGWRVA